MKTTKENILNLFNQKFNDHCILCNSKLANLLCTKCNVTHSVTDHNTDYTNNGEYYKLIYSIYFNDYNFQVGGLKDIICYRKDYFTKIKVLCVPQSYLPTVFSHHINNSLEKLIAQIKLLM